MSIKTTENNKIYPFYMELELIKPVIEYFKKQGYTVRREIKIGFHIADIVCFRDKSVVAVELKIRDWKKALVQLKNYQLGADYVYLAVPLGRSHNILRKSESILKKDGIGLLIINEKSLSVNEIIKPKKSTRNMGVITLNYVDRPRVSKFLLF